MTFEDYWAAFYEAVYQWGGESKVGRQENRAAPPRYAGASR